jgi:hypothetical protein
MRIINKVILTAIALSATTTYATTIQDYSFKSASLNGNGYSTFQMALENQQYQRSLAIEQALTAAAQQAKADAANTPINQFLTNLESRVYAQISQNLATAMFAGGSSSTGQITFQGNTIYYNNNGTQIQLQVTDNVGNVTTINIPLSQFNITGGSN